MTPNFFFHVEKYKSHDITREILHILRKLDAANAQNDSWRPNKVLNFANIIVGYRVIDPIGRSYSPHKGVVFGYF